jgi:threonine dehydratase
VPSAASNAVNMAAIAAAHERIRGAVLRSPCTHSLALSRLCGADIWCKFDNLQITGSFKERGARNKLMLLSAEQRKLGVIAASAGNHALGLAYHGQQLGIQVTVVMPKWAPLIKISKCRGFGANVILHGESYDDAKKHAESLSAERSCTYISGFDDPDIINGQGTMGLEILEDVPDLDAVIVPVGGAGLISGVGTAIKAKRPQARIIGVESRNAPTLHASLQRGQVTRIDTQPTLADGLAIAQVGGLCFDIAKGIIDSVVLVDESQIATAILRLLEIEKTVVEGAGASSLAAAMQRNLKLEGKKVVLLLCGGNIDVTVISRVIERGLAADGRLCRVTAHVSDRPGSLARLLSLIAATGASIKDVFHDRSFGPADVARVSISCTMETRDAAHIGEIHTALKAAGIEFDGSSVHTGGK